MRVQAPNPPFPRDAKRVKEKYSMKARRTLELKIIDYSVDFEKSEIESYALK